MITSGMSEEAAAGALDLVRGGEARIVYCSPERFGSDVFLDALAQRRIDLLAVDEAHCVSEWGHDFRPDYLRLPQIAERLGRPTVMACTATATELVADEIATRFGMREPLQVRSGFDRPNLSFDVVALEGKGSKARRLALLEAGLADPANRPAIVYCGTRKDTDEVAADAARAAGCSAVAYHAGMEAEERTEAQRRFMAGEVDVIVATNAFGMGVDKADVRSVWHMAIPTSVEAYYQEAGRAGRDGLPAKAVLLAMRADLGRLVRFNEQRSPDQEIARERGWRAYQVIKSFIYSDRCRRRQLLDHFGDRTAGGAAGAAAATSATGRAGCPTRRRSPSAGRSARRRLGRAGGRALRRRRAAVRRAEGLATRGGRRQARLHGRQQPHPERDRRAAPGRPSRADRDQRRRAGLHLQVRARGPGDRRRAPEAATLKRPPSGRLGTSAQGNPGDDLPHDPLGRQRGDVGRADGGRDHLDHLGPDQLEPARPAGGRRAAARRWSSRPAPGCRCRARRRGRGRRCRPRGRPAPPRPPRRRARRPRRCRAHARRA